MNKAALAAAEKSRHQSDLKAEHEKMKTLKDNLKVVEARAAELEIERDVAADKAKKAEHELGRMQRREKRKMKEVDGKAYQASFDRAGVEYKREARKMVNEATKIRMSITYGKGYKDGVATAAGVLQLEADLNLTKSIPEAVVPEFVLPNTDEKCALLPPKEFLESDEEIEDVSSDEAEDGSGAKSNAEDAEKAGEDATLNAEAKNVENA